MAIFASVPAYRWKARKCKIVDKHYTFRSLVPENDNNVMHLNFRRAAWCCLVAIVTLIVVASLVSIASWNQVTRIEINYVWEYSYAAENSEVWMMGNRLFIMNWRWCAANGWVERTSNMAIVPEVSIAIWTLSSKRNKHRSVLTPEDRASNQTLVARWPNQIIGEYAGEGAVRPTKKSSMSVALEILIREERSWLRGCFFLWNSGFKTNLGEVEPNCWR